MAFGDDLKQSKSAILRKAYIDRCNPSIVYIVRSLISDHTHYKGGKPFHSDLPSINADIYNLRTGECKGQGVRLVRKCLEDEAAPESFNPRE